MSRGCKKLKFHEALRAGRIAQRAKQAELACMLGVPPSYVSNWELGHSRPTPEQYRDLCNLIPELREALRPLTQRQLREHGYQRRAPTAHDSNWSEFLALVAAAKSTIALEDFIALLDAAGAKKLSVQDLLNALR